MEKLDKILIYDNNELKLVIINRYNKTPYIIYEKLIAKFRIKDLRKDTFLEKIKQKILIEKKNIQGLFKIDMDKIILLYNPQKLQIREITVGKEFEETTLINNEDINRIIKKGLNDNLTIEGYTAVDYKIIWQEVDSEVIESAIGKNANLLKLNLEVILIDSQTKDELYNLFKVLNIQVEKGIILDYYISKSLKSNNTCLIDLNYEVNKVFIKVNNQEQVNYLTTGIGTILEKSYEIFSRSYGEKKGEELTRILKKYWLLKKNDYQYDIIKDIDISVISEVIEHILIQYFELIFSKIPKDIVLENIFINSSSLPEKELTNILDKQSKYNIIPMYKNNLFISSIIDKKLSYCIRKIYKEMV
ncbi:MAG: hypothetical protein ACK5HR_01070 [Mycoplasmatales bacterium]